ncbi:MAG TPA: ClpX C4-type zinc finger protein [Xanthobacteraceae bacterium]|nr:ClpX C4-type zinc finger protein [Xanthobacteraceae bacterium]
MNDRASNLFQGLSSEWEVAISAGRQRDVLLSGVLAYQFFRQSKDAPFEGAVLVYLKKAIDDLVEKVIPECAKATPACSFCGRGEPEVRLAAGARAFICNSCVATLGDVFRGALPKG